MHKSLVQLYYYKLNKHVSLSILIAVFVLQDVVLSALYKRAILVQLISLKVSSFSSAFSTGQLSQSLQMLSIKLLRALVLFLIPFYYKAAFLTACSVRKSPNTTAFQQEVMQVIQRCMFFLHTQHALFLVFSLMLLYVRTLSTIVIMLNLASVFRGFIR